MKEHTLEDIKKSPSILCRFFLLQGKAELTMFDDAYEFYIKFSRHKKRKKGKRFTRKFMSELEYYNTAIK